MLYEEFLFSKCVDDPGGLCFCIQGRRKLYGSNGVQHESVFGVHVEVGGNEEGLRRIVMRRLALYGQRSAGGCDCLGWARAGTSNVAKIEDIASSGKQFGLLHNLLVDIGKSGLKMQVAE